MATFGGSLFVFPLHYPRLLTSFFVTIIGIMTSPADIKNLFSSLSGSKVTASDIAEILGVSRNAVNGRLQRGLTADDVIQIARGLDINPVECLQELGHVSLKDIYDFVDSDGTTLATASQEDLIYQLAADSLPFQRKLDMVSELSGHIDELQARRRSKAPREDVPLDLYIDQAAANSAPEEQEGAPGDYEA